MSDLYDSLEDGDDDKDSSDSPDRLKCASYNGLQGIDFSESKNSPFYLKQNDSGKETLFPNVHFNRKYSPSFNQNSNFLPKIENLKQKGSEDGSNIIVSNEVLSKQGLQLNNDGSFTKSPREDDDELPFITREYRNLQFQKKKTYQMKNVRPFAKIQRKNIFTFTEDPEKGISMTGIINARKKKGTSEELLTSGGSLSSFHENSKNEKELLVSDNLTDSMKEILLRKQNENRLRSVKKSKDARRNLKESSVNQRLPKGPGSHCGSSKEPKTNRLVGAVGTCESSGKTFRKHRSDILVNVGKPRLSYSERRQLESGFNPLSLRQGKKILSETNRSNFGDSVADKLSEISSRVLSSDDITDDEDEEMFYRNIIEKEKNRKMREQSSARSAPPETVPLNNVGFPASKDQKECTGSLKSNPTYKRLSKSTSIDMPSLAGKTSVRPWKKSPHYCSADSSPTLSKIELAQKAKAYGYLANARNIFKLKTQSGGKLNEKEKTSRSCENSPIVRIESKLNVTPKNREIGSSQSSGRLFRPISKTDTHRLSEEKEKSFVLPRVDYLEPTDRHIKIEILRSISTCLDGPSHAGKS